MVLSESKFNMWRTITALAHTDGVFHVNEEEYLTKIFDSLDFSKEQKEALISDMKNPKPPEQFYNLITEPTDRAEVIYFGRILLWADENLDKNEEEVLNKMRAMSLDKVDFENVMAKVNKISEDFKAKQASQKEARPAYQKIIDAIVFWEDLP